GRVQVGRTGAPSARPVRSRPPRRRSSPARGARAAAAGCRRRRRRSGSGRLRSYRCHTCFRGMNIGPRVGSGRSGALIEIGNLANESSREASESSMLIESRLCSRARFWVSLRLDSQLSELEGALLDAHLKGCTACSSFAELAELATDEIRRAPLASTAPVPV